MHVKRESAQQAVISNRVQTAHEHSLGASRNVAGPLRTMYSRPPVFDRNDLDQATASDHVNIHARVLASTDYSSPRNLHVRRMYVNLTICMWMTRQRSKESRSKA